MPDAFDAVTQRTVPASSAGGAKKLLPNASAFAKGDAAKPARKTATPINLEAVTIKKGVPLPSHTPVHRSSAATELLNRMVKGDSVELTTLQARNVKAQATKLKVEVALRKLGEDLYGVWRLS